MEKKKVVVTLTMVDKYGEKTICNMIEPLDATFDTVGRRIEDLQKLFNLVGNITIQFVTEDNV